MSRLATDWAVQLVGAPHIGDLYASLPALVARLNAAGVTRLEPAIMPNVVRRNLVMAALADDAATLGIGYLARTSGTEGEAGFALFFAPFQPAYDSGAPDGPADWFEAVLAGSVGARKVRNLLSADADERHIFVMAGSATPDQVEVRLRQLAMPVQERGPVVPDGITHAWMNSRFIEPRVGPVTGLWSVEHCWTVVPGEAPRA